MNNNLLELSGSVDLIATAICDFDTPTKHYKKDEVVLNLENIYSQAVVSNMSSKARSKSVVLDFSTMNVASIISSFIPLDKQIYDLLGEKPQEFNVIKVENVICAVDELLLPLNYIKNYNSVKIRNVENFTVENNEELQITRIHSNEIIKGETYFLQYEEKVIKNPILMDTFEIDIPYLKIQLKINGNINKDAGTSYLFVPKVRLSFIPTLQFNDDNVSCCTLRFSVIEDEEKVKLVF
jgi:hypothetical protein